jgi:hypothetical protein
MVGKYALDILRAIAPFLVVGGVGLPLLFLMVRVSRWRTHHGARKAGLMVVEPQRVVIDPHALQVTGPQASRHERRPVRSHRR